MKQQNSDWLNTSPIFYHEKTGKTGCTPNEVVDFANFDWDWEGLQLFMDYGYCVYTHTPIRHVRFLPPLSKLSTDKGCHTPPKEQIDIIFENLLTPTDPKDVLSLLSHKLSTWLSNQAEETRLILPLSGGLDSRLLLYHLKSHPHITTYTYGVSEDQSQNFEVLYAQQIAKLAGVSWQQIPLGNYLSLLPKWNQLFGISTHAHGMYQMEFYQKISEINKFINSPILVSGFIGDVWAGTVSPAPIDRPENLSRLGFSHGLKADSRFLHHYKQKLDVLDLFFEAQRSYLHHSPYLVILTMQNKTMLLRYLMQVPETMGWHTYAPFADQETALAMLRLPHQERKNRHWQRAFIEDIGWNIEEKITAGQVFNYLNHQAAITHPLPLLDVHLLREIVRPAYVEQINKKLLYSFWQRQRLALHRRFRKKRVLWRFFTDDFLPAYFAYLNLYPLQKLIEERNQYLS
ncbi:MAG: hypothetical protein ACFCUI_06780 [Bernardetiaceae bacterium]